MKIRDVTCPICGAMNYKIDLEETDGWMECIKCGATVLADKEKLKPVYKIGNLPKLVQNI